MFVWCGVVCLCECSAQLKLPAQSADPTARLFFRLAYLDPQTSQPVFFGDRFWLDNAWEEAAPASASASASAPAKAPEPKASAAAAPVPTPTPTPAPAPAPAVAAPAPAPAAPAPKPAAAAAAPSGKTEYQGKFRAELVELRAMGFAENQFSDEHVLALIFQAHTRKGGFNINWVVDQVPRFRFPPPLFFPF